MGERRSGDHCLLMHSSNLQSNIDNHSSCYLGMAVQHVLELIALGSVLA